MREDTLQLLICRHGHARQSEHDPELTSGGLRAARRLGEWAATALPDVQRILHTPTTRTRQTAEELALSVPEIPVLAWEPAPEAPTEWEAFTTGLARRGWQRAVLVAHHTTLLFLLREVVSGGPSLRHPPPTTALLVEGRPGMLRWSLRDTRIGPLA